MVVKIFFGKRRVWVGDGVGFTGVWCEKKYNMGIEFCGLGMV